MINYGDRRARAVLADHARNFLKLLARCDIEDQTYKTIPDRGGYVLTSMRI